MSTTPTLHDVVAARKIVYSTLKPTPLHQYPTLSKLVGAQIYIKHENHLPTGAFKVRGGLVMAAGLNPDQRGRWPVHGLHRKPWTKHLLRGARTRHSGDNRRPRRCKPGQSCVNAGFGSRGYFPRR